MTKPQALALVALVALVTGCTPEQPSAQATTSSKPAPGIPADQQAGDGDPADSADSADALPAGVELEFRHVVRSDEVVKRNGALPRRRMGLVYIGDEQEAVFDSVIRSMEDAGFTLLEQRPQRGDRLRAKFKKAGFGTAIVVVGPATGTDGGKRGRLLLDWPAGK